jgi:uncharacterized protein YukE
LHHQGGYYAPDSWKPQFDSDYQTLHNGWEFIISYIIPFNHSSAIHSQNQGEKMSSYQPSSTSTTTGGNYPPKPAFLPDGYYWVPVVTHFHPPECDQIADIFEKAGNDLREQAYAYAEFRANLLHIWEGKSSQRYWDMTGDISPMMEELYNLLFERAKELRNLQVNKYDWRMNRKD